MKATTKIFLDDRREKLNGSYPVKLRITFNRVRKYFPLDLDLTQSEFERITTGQRLNSDQDALRRKFNDVESKASIIIAELPHFTFSEFEKKFLNDRHYKTHLLQSFQTKIDLLKHSGQIGTAISYQCAVNSLIAFKGNLSFAEVDTQYLKAYEAWMLKDNKSVTTIGIYLRSLRSILNDAIHNGDLNIKLYPFGKNKYEVPTGKNIKKALPLDLIGLIYNYETPNKMQSDARDYWIFSYLCNGMNIKDIALLRRKSVKNETIEFIRAKTARTKRQVESIRIPLTAEAKSIIARLGRVTLDENDFVFPILANNMTPTEQKRAVSQCIQNINKNMKRIASILGIKENVTCMSARHSFSTILRNSGASTEMIGEALGHSNVKTTQNYLASFEDDQKKEAYKALTNFKKSI